MSTSANAAMSVEVRTRVSAADFSASRHLVFFHRLSQQLIHEANLECGSRSQSTITNCTPLWPAAQNCCRRGLPACLQSRHKSWHHRITDVPAVTAATCAIPPPICPAPRTPTCNQETILDPTLTTQIRTVLIERAWRREESIRRDANMTM